MILYTFLTTGLALMLSGIGLMLYDLRSLGADMEQDILSKSSMMKAACRTLLTSGDNGHSTETIEQVIAAVKDSKHIQCGAVFKPDGTIVASYSRDGEYIQFPGRTFDKREVVNLKSGEKEVFDPVLLPDGERGLVYLKNSSKFITDRRAKYIIILVVILVVSMGLTMISSTWLQSGFVKPVQDLVHTANRVSLEKDFSLRANKVTEDELGQLTDAFNLMLEKVQRRDKDLQASENKLRQVLDLVPHLIFAKDRSGKFILCNKALADNFGSTVEKVLSSTHMEMHGMHKSEESLQMHRDDLKVMLSGKPLQVEETLTTKDGHVIHLKTTKIPFFQSDTHETAILGIAIDITHEKNVENELRKAHADLQLANNELEKRVNERTAEVFQYQQKLVRQEKLAAVGQVSGSIAHELRNPLGAIKQSIFFLTRYTQKHKLAGDHPKIGEHLKTMDEELVSADHVISSLLDMSRVKKMERIEVEMNQMVEDIRNRCTILPPKQFVAEVSHNPLNFQSDPVQFRQVLVNLVNNAKDATAADGKIEVIANLDKSANMVKIEVRDNGSGIAKESMDRIFEPLYTTKTKGNGLGLSICKQIIEEHHGGRMEVESELGVGTCFTLHLPLDNTQAPS